jgi:hypothetical protein
MKLFKTILFLFVVGSICSCNDDDIVPTLSDCDYLIFGHFYGECGGEGCIETYKLTSSELFEDEVDAYAGQGPFDFNKLNTDKHNLVKDLLDELPSELISSEDQTFGCPDCGDWGGLYIQYHSNDQVGKWRLDQMDMDDGFLNDFRDVVNEKIRLINL